MDQLLTLGRKHKDARSQQASARGMRYDYLRDRHGRHQRTPAFSGIAPAAPAPPSPPPSSAFAYEAPLYADQRGADAAVQVRGASVGPRGWRWRLVLEVEEGLAQESARDERRRVGDAIVRTLRHVLTGWDPQALALLDREDWLGSIRPPDD